MSRFHTQIEVPRGIQETFAFVSDFSNSGKWDPNVQSASMLTPGPIGLATMFQLVGGLRLPFTQIKPPWIGEFALPYQVVSFDPPALTDRTGETSARIRLEGRTSVMRYVDVITFQGDAKSTQIDYDALLTMTGMLTLAGWLLPQLVNWIGTSATKGLRAAVEANVPAPVAVGVPVALEARHAP
jgi:hypothetical protein